VRKGGRKGRKVSVEGWKGVGKKGTFLFFFISLKKPFFFYTSIKEIIKFLVHNFDRFF
jgi:hypothetical protein